MAEIVDLHRHSRSVLALERQLRAAVLVRVKDVPLPPATHTEMACIPTSRIAILFLAGLTAQSWPALHTASYL